MKKKILLSTIVIMSIAMLTACGGGVAKIETEPAIYDEDWGATVELELPKEKGYSFTDDGVHSLTGYNWGDFALKGGEKAEIYFSNERYVYHTHVDFKKNFPELDAENPSIKEMAIALKEEMGYELTSFNGYDAIFTPIEEGPSDNLVLKGYRYFVDYGNPQAYMCISILAASEDVDVSTLLEDPEVKVILDSIKLTNKD